MKSMDAAIGDGYLKASEIVALCEVSQPKPNRRNSSEWYPLPGQNCPESSVLDGVSLKKVAPPDTTPISFELLSTGHQNWYWMPSPPHKRFFVGLIRLAEVRGTPKPLPLASLAALRRTPLLTPAP